MKKDDAILERIRGSGKVDTENHLVREILLYMVHKGEVAMKEKDGKDKENEE